MAHVNGGGDQAVNQGGDNGGGDDFGKLEWLVVGVLGLLLVAWLYCLPKRQPDYKNEALAGLVKATTNPYERDQLSQDQFVWNRYESVLRTFEYLTNFNWYWYASLRALVIALAAITPALIVAPGIEKRKFLTALPAAIVAIGAGLISEFDFKMEAVRYDSGRVALLSEKSSYVTHTGPLYAVQDEKACNASAKPGALASGDSNVPYPVPCSIAATRANFAYSVEKIFQKEAAERDNFLSGAKPATAAVSTKPATEKPASVPK